MGYSSTHVSDSLCCDARVTFPASTRAPLLEEELQHDCVKRGGTRSVAETLSAYLPELAIYALALIILIILFALNGVGFAQNLTDTTRLTAPPAGPASLQSVSPFTITGFLQTATLDTSADVLSGGTMMVNGFTVVVPRNAVIKMPGTFLTWAELFTLAPKPWGPTQTGLALSDNPKPLTTYEVTVQGNRVIGTNGKDQHIAGLIFIAQQSVNTSQGFINSIDYATGEMRIGKTPGSTDGARVILNDPLGRFARANSPDIRFTVDENNPTVRAANGYPMCVPRLNATTPLPPGGIPDDQLCPQTNRPKDPVTGNYVQVFNMPPPPCTAFAPLADGTTSVMPPNCEIAPPLGTPDATLQMPFEVGDYVTYSGTLVADKASPGCNENATGFNESAHPNRKCEYISASSVVANVSAFTAPGIMPAYIGVDAAILGTGGLPQPIFPQEATVKIKVVGFTTDPTNVVDIFGMDLDPCTGTPTDRYFGTQIIDQVAKKGRFQFTPAGGAFLPPVRQLRIVSRTLSAGAKPAVIDPRRTFANGLIAGQYVAPIQTYIFPEQLEVSDAPVALNFQDFPFLSAGSGPWPGFASTSLPTTAPAFATGLTANQFAPDPGQIVSQLTPWPGATPPQTTVCSTGPAKAPIANAGPNQTVVAGAKVQLDGTASADGNVPPNVPLTYFWTQISGTPVALSDASIATPTFTAPLQADTLTFSLAVLNTKGVVSVTPTTVTITVSASAALLVDAGPAQSVAAGALVILTGAVSDPNATVFWQQVSGPAVTLNNPTTLTPNFTAPAAQILAPTDLVFRLTATSTTLGTASATVTITVKPQVDALLLTAVYQKSKARLTITVSTSSTAPPGTAVITASFADQQLQLFYNPGLNAYTAVVVGILPPTTVTANSSLGGTITRFVLVVP
jgi:hypothetical protein